MRTYHIHIYIYIYTYVHIHLFKTATKAVEEPKDLDVAGKRSDHATATGTMVMENVI